MPNKGLLWGLAYSAFSIGSFGASVLLLALNSYDFLTFLQELTDSFRLTILLNFIVFCCLSFGYLSVRVLFHRFRIIEIEHIADQLPFYALNLLFILFNDGNMILNTVLTGLTLLLKVHHIMTYERIDFLQVQVVNRMSQQQFSKARVFASFFLNAHVIYLFLLLPADFVLARFLAYDVFQGIGSMGSLLFGIQFGVLGLDCFAFLGKLVLNVYELVFYRCVDVQEDLIEDEDVLEEHIWESRAVYVQGFEIFNSILKTLFYAAFLYTLYFHSRVALPIPLIQGCIVSIHQAFKKVYQLMSFLSHSRFLEDQLACPSEEELVAADYICIICREDMHFPETFAANRNRPLNPRKHPKKLQCGHILHLCCLKDWLERSDSCPLCRKVVFKKAQPVTGRNATNPPAPTPVGRPEPPAATNMETAPHTTISTPTPDSTPTAMSENGVATHLEPQNVDVTLANLLPSNTQIFPTQEGDGNNKPAFIPRDWTLLPLIPTSEAHRFDVRLSSTETAQLTIRQNDPLI